jgi:Tfp pilus assembly protein PilV
MPRAATHGWHTRRAGPFGPASQRGYSLVDALVASGLLAAAVAGLAQLFVVAARANADARDTTYATVLAAQKIEELRAAAFPDTMGAESIDYLDAHGAMGAPGALSMYERRWTIEPLPAYPLDAVVITVVVSARAAPSHRAVRLTTIRARKAP